MRIFLAEYGCSTNGADSTSSDDVKNPQANFNDLENNVLPEESMMSCSIKHGMITVESLWTRRRSRKADSVR